MNLQHLNPWNWFKDEENAESSSVPVKRKDTNSALTTSSASANHHPFVQLQRSIDQLFDDAFQHFGFPSLARSTNGLADFQAKINISSDEKNYHVSLAIPGLTEKDVSLDLYQGKLTIRGEKKETNENKDRHYYRVEHSYGSFQRVLSLPEDVNQEDITANIKNGVLDITLPRKELPQKDVKRIPVNS